MNSDSILKGLPTVDGRNPALLAGQWELTRPVKSLQCFGHSCSLMNIILTLVHCQVPPQIFDPRFESQGCRYLPAFALVLPKTSDLAGFNC